MKFIYSFIWHILVHGLLLVQELECLILVHYDRVLNVSLSEL